MEKLVCNIVEVEAIKNKIKLLVEEYNELLKTAINLEIEGTNYWFTESQKAYINKFLERKKDLEDLSKFYSQLVSFLSTTVNSYKKIEDNYC